MTTIGMRADISEYASRVLGVIKEKFGLRNRGEAINKFAELYGEEFIESEVKDEIVKKMIKDCEQWAGRFRFKRKISIKELDKLSGM